MIGRADAVAVLRHAGFVAAEEDAADLLAAAGDDMELEALLARRLAGEPTAWIVGHVDFLGIPVRVRPGVYVARWKSEQVARHAVSHLPVTGIAVDLCTGSGALAAFLRHARPRARVVATDIDAAAVACALDNGIEAHLGDLFEPLPPALRARVDVVVAVPPYVPDDMLALLPRDVARREPAHALAGGLGGLDVVERVVAAAGGWLRPGGALVVEAGIDQMDRVAGRMEDHGLVVDRVVEDGDGDPCGVCATTA
ncbi:MAG: methyltransferase [Actinobacteria bacterium]|nr:methyltransferase [Actinomycetota bacterium]